MTASEYQMLASMKRQHNEELEDNGPSHGLSASQIDNCNISISTSSDDATTWNSCLPEVSFSILSVWLGSFLINFLTILSSFKDLFSSSLKMLLNILWPEKLCVCVCSVPSSQK